MKTIQDLNIAVIGAGRHATANLHAAIPLTGATVSCVLTRSETSARNAAESLGANRYYYDIEKMLDGENLDAVIICVAPEDQALITIRCLQAGIPVFVEKPLGMNASEARNVLAASRKHDVPVMVAFMKRYAPAYQRLCELIADEQQFGRILTVDAAFSFCPWTTDLRDASFLQQGAIHMVDLLRATFGKARVVAALGNSNNSDIGLAYALRFATGAVCTVSMSASQVRSSTSERVTVVGTNGWVEAVNLKAVSYRLDVQEAVMLESWNAHQNIAAGSPLASPAAMSLREQGFYGEIDHFLRCVADGRPPSPCAAENVETMILCDEMIDKIDS